jgi:hypothetical protein
MTTGGNYRIERRALPNRLHRRSVGNPSFSIACARLYVPGITALEQGRHTGVPLRHYTH